MFCRLGIGATPKNERGGPKGVSVAESTSEKHLKKSLKIASNKSKESEKDSKVSKGRRSCFLPF